MSKILIEGNKVIIDGHANDLETCNTLTNLCDELSTSEKFRTVKYESGYGEFESVSDNEEKKFADPEPTIGYQVNIQSNDGATILAQNNSIDFVVVTSNGAQLKRGYTVIVTYTYAGSKLFAGLATSANATVPKYKPGDTIAITAETTLYIVENIIIPDHHRSLTELFTNIAAVIREKTGSTEPIIADAFPTAIDAIPSGSEEMKIVQVVVKGVDPSACSVWDVKQNAWVDYTTGGVTVNVIDYLAVRPKGQVMQGIYSYIRLKDGTEYNCTGDVGKAWLVGDMMSFAVINFAYTSYDSFFNVHYNPIKVEDIDYIYISTQAD